MIYQYMIMVQRKCDKKKRKKLIKKPMWKSLMNGETENSNDLRI